MGATDLRAERPSQRVFIFLNRDGTTPLGLVVLVAFPSGVVYGHQCAGLATEERHLEGFLVPAGGPAASAPFVAFFAAYGGNPPDSRPRRERDGTVGPPYRRWTSEELAALARLVASVPCWYSALPGRGERDQRQFLALDYAREAVLTEAWVPVLTPYGPGVLLFDNSD